MPAKTSEYEGRNLDGEAVRVKVSGRYIAAVEPIAGDPELPLIAPPLVDVQHNGARGHAFCDLDEGGEALRAIAAHARRHGVGRIMATVVTAPLEQILRSLRNFDRSLEADADLERFYPGLFFEGRYMSADEGWRGCHDRSQMHNPSWDEWAALQDAAGGRIRVFNVDPSRPGALAAIRGAVSRGVRVSMGHCGPEPDVIRAAADAGADLVTHFGNGAPPMIHRHRNPFWSWLADDRLSLGVIADGHHLPEDLLRTVFKAKGRRRVFPVSDAAELSGLPPGEYGDTVIEEDGYCHIRGQEILAGAWHQLDRGVENLCHSGWTPAAAWRQCSEVPARVMGIPAPQLAPGGRADLVLSRWNCGLELLQAVWGGEELLPKPINPRMP